MTAAPPAAACPACGSMASSPAMRPARGYPILACGGCGLTYTDARLAPPPATLYPPFDQHAGRGAIRRALGLFLARRAAIAASAAGPGRRLLDYGCGSGAFATAMAARGFGAVGLEPFSLGAPGEGPGLRLIRGPLDEHLAGLGRFDVVTLWHVLEHLDDPIGVLSKLAGLLADGGAIVVSVPNLSSWQRRIFGPGWFHLDPPRHLAHYDRASLSGVLRSAGLEVVAEHRHLPEYGWSGWVQSALNAALPRPNVLYEFAKDRGALRGLEPSTLAALLGASLALGAPSLAASIPLEALASMMGGQAALTVVARKIGGRP